MRGDIRGGGFGCPLAERSAILAGYIALAGNSIGQPAEAAATLRSFDAVVAPSGTNDLMLADSPHIYILGGAVSVSWADRSRSLNELIFAGVQAALKNSRVAIETVDSVVLAAHDLVDGLSLSSMVTSPAAGSYLRDEIRLADDGLAAVSLAAARVAAGESRTSIVAAWGRASESGFAAASPVAMDPFHVAPFGLTESDISAMRLTRWLQRFPDARMRHDAAENRRRRAAINPRAINRDTRPFPVNFPLRPEEAPALADVVAAIVISAEPGAVRMSGIGHGTELPAIGDRDLLAMPALKQAVSSAMAGTSFNATDIGVIEIDGTTLVDEALALEAIDLAAPGGAFATIAERASINPSGGGAAGWCYPAMGLARLVECYLQMTGAAGAVQLAGDVRTGLAVGSAPIGAQTRTAVLLETC